MTGNLRDLIDGAKARLPLPELLARLNLSEHAKPSARCPLHEDRSPSFSVFKGDHGWRWRCFARCGSGDEVNFLERYLSLDTSEAIQLFCKMAGEECPIHRAVSSSILSDAGRPKLVLPDDAGPGTLDEWVRLAELRGISYLAPAKAVELGTLRFATVFGYRCWIITDLRRLCAEARRLDGAPFPAIGTLGERKAHTLRGSNKSWPVGLSVQGFRPVDFRAVLAVEGGPDYLAALDFTLFGGADCLPITFLGAGAGNTIHREAVALLRDRRIRFYPHADLSGAGTKAVDHWADQLKAAGARIDAFDFSGLRRSDGQLVKDLNDCTSIHEESRIDLEGLLP